MGGGKESTESINRYKMNKQKQPLSGPVDGKKEQRHNNTMSLEVYEERRDSLSWKGGGDTVDGKSKCERNSPTYEATLHSYYYWQLNNLYWQKKASKTNVNCFERLYQKKSLHSSYCPHSKFTVPLNAFTTVQCCEVSSK